MLFIISGSSGVGKNTIINDLLKQHSDFEFMQSYTSREMRDFEKQGDPYYFVSKSTFEDMINQGLFYEYELVHDNYYGTAKTILQEKMEAGKILIKDLDVCGALNLEKKMRDEERPILIFLTVDKEELLRRLLARKEQAYQLRLQRFEYEQSLKKYYDYIIENYDRKKTERIILSIINQHRNNQFLLSSQSIRNMNESKIYQIARKMQEGQIFEPIEVTLHKNKTYIVDGHHRYMASIVANKKIAKKYVDTGPFVEIEQYSWEDGIVNIKKFPNNHV